MRELTRHGFQDLGLSRIWCGYFDGNEQSRRAQEKCGYRFQRTEFQKPYPALGESKTQHIALLTRQQWEESQIKGESL